MKPSRPLRRIVLALGSLVAVVGVAVLAPQTHFNSGQAPAARLAPQDQPAKDAPVRKAYFGDLHVHTGWSNDAYNLSVRTTPEDAYLFAKGEGIRLHTGEMVKLIKPLDFMGVTEHAEYQGIMSRLQDPKSPLFNHPLAKDLRSNDVEVRTKATLEVMNTVMRGKPFAEFVDKKVVGEIWQDIVKTANKHNQPGKFTALIGIEWSSNGPKGYQNLHRNIIFRGDKAMDMPFTTFDSLKPEDLWTYLEDARKEKFELLVGKEVRIKNLPTGAEYTATYGKDGMRTLAATAGWASAHGQGAAKEKYEINNGKLSSRLEDGSQISSRVYKHGDRYLAARDDEAGYVNYEIFPR